MLLTELQNYLKTHHQVSLAELTNKYNIEADALRGMLEKLIRKGRVSRMEGKVCGKCHHCDPETLELYQWTA